MAGRDEPVFEVLVTGLRRFVFITGTSEHTDYQGFIDDVKVPVLTKPFDMMNLVRVVQTRLAG